MKVAVTHKIFLADHPEAQVVVQPPRRRIDHVHDQPRAGVTERARMFAKSVDQLLANAFALMIGVDIHTVDVIFPRLRFVIWREIGLGFAQLVEYRLAQFVQPAAVITGYRADHTAFGFINERVGIAVLVGAVLKECFEKRDCIFVAFGPRKDARDMAHGQHQQRGHGLCVFGKGGSDHKFAILVKKMPQLSQNRHFRSLFLAIFCIKTDINSKTGQNTHSTNQNLKSF